jgi:ketosteroid isomerase-like protein
MSDEHLELSRRLYDAWNAGDMEALRELHDDEVVMRHPDGWPEPGPSVGRDAVFRQFELLREDWEIDRVEVHDMRAAGDYVVARHSWHAEGGHSGASSELNLSSVFRFRDGKVIASAFYWDHADALAAAGIREQARSPRKTS